MDESVSVMPLMQALIGLADRMQRTERKGKKLLLPLKPR
jgi:hypothetical protein